MDVNDLIVTRPKYVGPKEGDRRRVVRVCRKGDRAWMFEKYGSNEESFFKTKVTIEVTERFTGRDWSFDVFHKDTLKPIPPLRQRLMKWLGFGGVKLPKARVVK